MKSKDAHTKAAVHKPGATSEGNFKNEEMHFYFISLQTNP